MRPAKSGALSRGFLAIRRGLARILSFSTPMTRVSDREVRAEIWRLGSRHMGWPLEGALDELKAPDLPAGRAQLLRACVRQLQSS